MFLIRIQNINPFLNATTLFTQIANQVDLKFERYALMMIARHQLPLFEAVMFMPEPLFAHYSADRSHASTISLHYFHNALLDGRQDFSSMTMHLLERTSRMILRFENSWFMPQLRRELTFWPAQNYILGQLIFANTFSIDAEEFKRIITTLSIYENYTILVTLTNSEANFSVATEEITLTKEGGKCIIVGDIEDEIQFLISIHPTSFFISLANQAPRVWFFKTTDSRSAINIPFEVCAQYLIYFPKM